MNQYLHALDMDGLKQEASRIEEEMRLASAYEALNHTAEGMFLKEEFEVQAERARSLYRHINPTHEHALIALMQIQAREVTANAWLSKITQSTEHIKELEERKKRIFDIAEQQRKRAESGEKFIPDAARKE